MGKFMVFLLLFFLFDIHELIQVILEEHTIVSDYYVHTCDSHHTFVSKKKGERDAVKVSFDVKPKTFNIKVNILLVVFGITQDNAIVTDLMSEAEIVDVMNEGGEIEFRVSFPHFKRRAKVKKMIFNGKEVCSENLGDLSKIEITNINVSIHRGYTIQEKVTQPTPRDKKPLLPKHVKCGTVSSIETLIIGGDETSISKWPWSAALVDFKGSDVEFICGGAIISMKLVITAAHCVDDKKKVNVRLGLDDPVTGDGDDFISYEAKPKIHPNYDKSTLRNDIALLPLNREIEFKPNIMPICLWNGNADNSKGAMIQNRGMKIIVGWGSNEENETAEQLSQLIVNVISNKRCKENKASFRKYLWEKSFCAVSKSNSGPCNGDSGSGLYIKIDDVWYIRGMISYGEKIKEDLCNRNDYAVYTDVSKYINWIMQTNALY